MRGKKAKALRKLALSQSKDLPARRIDIVKNTIRKKHFIIVTQKTGLDGKRVREEHKIPYSTATGVNGRDTQRGVYLAIKKVAK